MFVKAWNSIPVGTSKNCFKNSGISQKSMEKALTDEDDSFADADIIAEVSGHVYIDNEEESDDEEQPTDCISKPAFKEILNAITILEDHSLFSNFGANLIKALKNVYHAFDLDSLSNKK